MAAPSQMISSPSNPLLKDIRRAVSRGTLTAEGYLVAESFHLLEEALRSKLEIKVVLASPGASGPVERRLEGRGVPVRVIEDSIFAGISSAETSQGVVALVRPRGWTVEDIFRGHSLVVVLDGLQDPGNAGAVVRTAEAFGVTGMLFAKGTVSSANTKCLRASAGSLFRMPFLEGMGRDRISEELRRRAVKRFAASSRGEADLEAADFTSPSALIIGSEAHGVSESLLEGAQTVRIATVAVESLNAAVAAAVILYQAARQRARQRELRQAAEGG